MQSISNKCWGSLPGNRAHENDKGSHGLPDDSGSKPPGHSQERDISPNTIDAITTNDLAN